MKNIFIFLIMIVSFQSCKVKNENEEVPNEVKQEETKIVDNNPLNKLNLIDFNYDKNLFTNDIIKYPKFLQTFTFKLVNNSGFDFTEGNISSLYTTFSISKSIEMSVNYGNLGQSGIIMYNKTQNVIDRFTPLEQFKSGDTINCVGYMEFPKITKHKNTGNPLEFILNNLECDPRLVISFYSGFNSKNIYYIDNEDLKNLLIDKYNSTKISKNFGNLIVITQQIEKIYKLKDERFTSY